MKNKKSILAQFSMLSFLLALVVFSFAPRQVQAFEHPITVPCTIIESYGSGGERDRVCSADNCSWQNHELTEEAKTCTIEIPE